MKEFSSIFTQNGYSVYLVGGAVRDFLLGEENHDYDFTTDATPLEVKSLFRRTIDTGIQHGTVTVLFKGESFEVTTFRSEEDYQDMRHPGKVTFVRSLEEDLKRRDFTINAFACRLEDGRIIDLHDGLLDLGRKRIRAIGDPKERFTEDALRMLRACRFSAKLDFEIEEETFHAITELSANIDKVSKERIKEELFSLIFSRHPERGLEALRKSGLLEHILPELSAAVGFELGGVHEDDLYTHSVKALLRARDNCHSKKVKLAALFHDLGKLETRREDASLERPYTFYGHEEAGARTYEALARRLKMSNEERLSVSHLIRNHMFAYSSEWTDAAVRRFINRIGYENLPDLVDLRRDDAESISGFCHMDGLRELEERCRKEIEKKNALSIRDLEINGKDLIALGLKPGPSMGAILENLLEEVIETPSLNRREYLTAKARMLIAELG